jgi:hypothetical protein
MHHGDTEAHREQTQRRGLAPWRRDCAYWFAGFSLCPPSVSLCVSVVNRFLDFPREPRNFACSKGIDQ